MRLKVLNFNRQESYHVCVDSFDNKYRLDLFVDSSIQPEEFTVETIIGKEIEVNETYPYVSIARGVTVLD